MSMILWLLMLLLPLLLQIFSSSANSGTNIILSLSLRPSPGNRSDILKRHADASLHRAQTYLLQRNDDRVPLHPRSYGGYSVSLSFGTPRQTLSFLADTGSSLTWFPCTFQKYNYYNCTNCYVDPTTQIPVFTPNKSSSYKTIPCLQSRQCDWLSPGSKCNKDRTKCVYGMVYGKGDTAGYLLNETLDLEPGLLSGVVVDNFTVGCSVITDEETEDGILGLGRAPESLPAQMGLKSFSYYMISHNYDDNATAPTGDLVLTKATGGKGGAPKFNYTPFVTNPRVRDFSDYYYVKLQSISVGRVVVKVSDEYVVPNATGHGGTIVDSGTTLTMLKKPLFDSVLKEIQKQVGKKYAVDKIAQNQTGLEPCYRVPAAAAGVKLPQLTFTFQGCVEMVPPLPNYFSYADDQGSVICMTIMRLVEQVGLGPAIILGNYLQQDYYMEYDLENKRLGIRQQK